MSRTVHRLDRHGTIRDWLTGPAWSSPAGDLGAHLDATGPPWGPHGRWRLTNGPDATPLKEALHRARPLPADGPVPAAAAEGAAFTFQGHEGTWRRAHTAADGLVDWSAFCFTPEYRTALAAATVEVDQAEWRELRVAGTGPVRLFHDGAPIGGSDRVSYMEPLEWTVRVWLPSGVSTLVAALWQAGFRECRQILRVRVAGPPVRVIVPCPGADEDASARAEDLLDAVGLAAWAIPGPDAAAELTGPDGARLRVWWPGGPDRGGAVTLDGGRARIPLAGPPGPVRLRVGVDAPGVPVHRDLDGVLLPGEHRERPVGTPDDWRRELLEHAAAGAGAPAALARWTLTGDAVTADPLGRALTMIRERADCADFEAVGLLNLWHRVPPGNWAPGLRDEVRAALRGFKYWIDQPGLDAMCYFTENHQLVWHTAETLAGEAFRDDVFGNTGWTGRRHAEHGRAMAGEWMTRRLAGGFSEFDSNAYLAIDLLALVSLAELGADRALAGLAAGLADRVLFSLAANSWRGVHGCAHGRSYVGALRSSRLEETAPIMRLCFGVGALNDALLPATVLATARGYAVPAVVRAVADHGGDWRGRQRYRGRYLPERDLLDRPYGSDVVVHRTPDVMLASAQDYRAGLPGLQEHVWGATLGPETQIFVTHPPNASVSPSSRPNAWAGNRVLPRVRQHGGTLLALYAIPPDDPVGRTHAWFPRAHLDEWAARGPWTAGRRGDGYVALAVDGGAEFVTAGSEAWQELVPRGPGTAWVCVVGRRATHGSFAAFVDGLATPAFGAARVRYARPGEPALELAWSGPFTVNGRVPAADPETQLDNPACRLRHGDPGMIIAFGGATHRIDLRTGRRSAGA
ncbi:hypothetical protein [Catenuloplanes atrovinosus]|uniref:Uncharacterized protein n=1 Tax=Catenuloplanes atrovinosus TaxID=137266 RepID=A0AAE4C9S8_9ACTN|nr:hypothetical protein [Catenuloplanes atrovinosus]MDR7276866.1 hypothetical protein [Catenuloplanes atrovinosus]